MSNKVSQKITDIIISAVQFLWFDTNLGFDTVCMQTLGNQHSYFHKYLLCNDMFVSYIQTTSYRSAFDGLFMSQIRHSK